MEIYDHILDGVKGWPSDNAVDKSALMNDTTDTIYAGTCMYLHATTHKFVRGLATDAVGILATKNSTDPSVSPGDDRIVGGGYMTGLVTLWPAEVETTEFKTGTYNSNTLITAENSDSSTLGKIKEGTKKTDTIFGAVSDGKTTNQYGKSVVRFWTGIYLPTLT